MNLLGELHIEHAVLHDLDSSTIKKKDINEGLNKLIQQSKNACTRGIECLAENLELMLGIALKETDRWKKASQILMAVQQENVEAAKLNAFKAKVEALVLSLANRTLA
jgi:hypothetical protein